MIEGDTGSLLFVRLPVHKKLEERTVRSVSKVEWGRNSIVRSAERRVAFGKKCVKQKLSMLIAALSAISSSPNRAFLELLVLEFDRISWREFTV